MADPTTLQQRQQEIHRPFQPLDNTEGRQGRAIAEPQEQYAGIFTVTEDATANVANVYTQGKKANKEKTELNIEAANIFAQAAYQAEHALRTASPETREVWARFAAEAEQTEHEYVIGLALENARQTAEDRGISYWDMKYAEEKAFKVRTKGFETIDTRQAEYDKATVDYAAKNGYAVYDPGTGKLDEEATLQEMGKAFNLARYSMMNPEEKAIAIYSYANISPADYAATRSEEQRARYDSMMIQGVLKDLYVPGVTLGLADVKKALAEGRINDYREALQNLHLKLDEIENDILSSPAPKAVRDALMNKLTSMRTNIIKSYEERPDRTVKDFQNTLTVMQTANKIDGYLQPGEINQLARLRDMLGDQATGQFIQAWIARNPAAFGVGNTLGLAAQNLSPDLSRVLNNVAGNYANLLSGQQPIFGDNKDRLMAGALASQTVDAYTKDLNKRQAETSLVDIEGNTQKATAVHNDALRRTAGAYAVAKGIYLGDDPDTQLGDYVDMLNKPDYVAFLTRKSEEDTRKLIAEATPDVTTKYLKHPSISGVLSQVEPSNNRWLAYDISQDKIITGQASQFLAVGPGFEGGTSNWTMNSIADSLNKIYIANLNAKSLETNRDVTQQEKLDIINNMWKQLQLFGVPKDLLLEPLTETPKNSK